MKIAAACFLVTISFSINAFSMGKSIARITDESLSEVKITKDFNLRATDGAVLKFVTGSNQKEILRSQLPKPENADLSLCGKEPQFDLFIKLSDIGIALLQQQRGVLNEDEIAVLKTTPHCDPYLTSLNLIGSALRAYGEKPVSIPGEKMASLSVKVDKSSQSLILKTESKKSAAFKISSGLDRVKEVRDLSQVKILASASGQNIGMRFFISDVAEMDPTKSKDSERCTYTSYERQCRYDRKEKREICESIKVEQEGRRRVISTSNQTLYTIGVEFIDLQSQVVASAEIHDLDWDIDSKYGACEPLGRPGRF